MYDLVFNPMFIQFIGAIALIFSIMVFQVDSRRKMLKLHIGSSLFYTIHLFLLGGYSGSIVNLVNAARNYCFYKVKLKKHRWIIPVGFIAIFAIVVFITWKDYYSVMPLIGAVFGTLAFWQKDPKLVRIFSLIVAPPWFIYSVMIGSVPMMISEVIMFSSDIVGLLRYDYHPKFSLRDFDSHHKKKLRP